MHNLGLSMLTSRGGWGGLAGHGGWIWQQAMQKRAGVTRWSWTAWEGVGVGSWADVSKGRLAIQEQDEMKMT